MVSNMKVLMILTWAPDYREDFLREIGRQVDLTVVARPCEPDGLSAPESRSGYKYIEIAAFRCCGFAWQPGLRRWLYSDAWDAVCIAANWRQLSNIFLFFTSPSYWTRWIWWGFFLGRSKSMFIKFLKKPIIKKAAARLTHGKSIVARLQEEYGIDAISFNNTEIKENEFRVGKFTDHKALHLLFVGSCKPRKQLDRLVKLAMRRMDVHVRLVGPFMEQLAIPSKLSETGRVQIFEHTIGKDLNQHFDWADLVVSPGNVGLLVTTAARHGKGIVIDSESYHGPEFYLAKETDQPFISFGDNYAVDQFIDQLHESPALLQQWGKALQDKARQEYTIESMAEIHVKVFKEIAQISKNEYC